MSLLYGVMKESHPPTAVHCSASGAFTDAEEQNVLVAKGSALEIMALRHKPGAEEGEGEGEGEGVLEVIGRYDMFGIIECMELVRFPGRARDSLIMAFRDAKLSVVEWDPANNDVHTSSLHYYEEESLRKGRVNFDQPPILRIDPLRRCAALLVYESKLIVLPFRHRGNEGGAEEEEEVIGGAPQAKRFKGADAPTANAVVRLGQPEDRNSHIKPGYVIDLQDAGIKNVIDFAFLEGYFEASVLFLHENKRTWVGRVAVLKNTCQLTALSLNLAQKRHPMIWSASGLPFNCRHIVPVPPPAGGAIVVSSNILIYRNHGTRCALKLNDYSLAGGDGNLKYDSMGEPVIFDTVQPVRLDGYQLMFGLMKGGAFVLSMHVDVDGQTVKRLELERGGLITSEGIGTASTMARLGDDHVFFGSRSGDSCLLKIVRRARGGGGVKSEVLPVGGAGGAGVMEVDGSLGGEEKAGGEGGMPAAAQVKVEQEGGAEGGDSDDDLYGGAGAGDGGGGAGAGGGADDSDDELYGGGGGGGNGTAASGGGGVGGGSSGVAGGAGEGAAAAAAAAAAANQQPIAQDDMPMDVLGQMEEFDDEDVAMYATVRTDGVDDAGGAGARSAVPLRAYDLVEQERLFGVGPIQGMAFSAHRGGPDDSRKDGCEMVVASGGGSSGKVCVLQRSVKPVVTTAVDLSMAQAVWTVHGPQGGTHAFMVISLGGDEPATVVLKGNELEEFDEDESMDFYTQGSTLCVANLFEDKRIVQVTAWSVLLLNEATKELELPLVSGSQVVAASVHDPYIALLLEDGRLQILVGDMTTMQINFTTELVEDVASACMFTPSQSLGPMLAASNSMGDLRILTLPTLAVVYEADGLALGNSVLVHSSISSADSSAAETAADEAFHPPFVLDLRVSCMPRVGPPRGDGWNGVKICLVAITSSADLLIYRSFYHQSPGGADAGDAKGLRLRRCHHEAMLRGSEIWDDMFVDEMELGDHTRRAALGAVRHTRLMPLGGTRGLEGVMVAAKLPHIIIFGRGDIRVHPLRLDRSEGVRSSARFTNPQCDDGLVMIADKGRDRARGMLKICTLPDLKATPDTAWATRVKQQGVTVHNLAFHAATGCHVAIVSWLAELDDPERRPEGAYEGEIPPLVEERFQMRLLAPFTLETIDTHDFDYEQGESGLCVTVAHLKNTRQLDVLLPFICVGTGFVNGESEFSRATGRIYVFDISTIVGEEGYKGKSSFKFKKLWESSLDQDIKGPVTAMCQVEGYLLVAQGPNPGMIGGSKLYVYELVNDSLVGRSFYDAHFFVTSIKTMKFYIAFGDARHGVHLLRWREDIRKLQLLARDPLPLSIYAVEFIVMGSTFGILASDEHKNLLVYVFNPASPEYRRQQLIVRCDLHLGSHVNRFLRWTMPFRPSSGVRIAAHYSTADGALGSVAPLAEDSYRKLLALQNLLATSVPHFAGLNPKSWRLFRPELVMKRRYAKNMLDGGLLTRYLSLNFGLQNQLARAIASDRDAVLGLIHDMLTGTLIT